MVNFFYVNNICISAKTARARQVYENHLAFKKAFDSKYTSLLPENSFLIKSFKSDSSKIRKVFFYLNFLKKISSLDKSYIIYSRNLYLLDIARKKGFKTVWEAHDLPKGRNEVAIKNLVGNSRFVAISNALKKKLSEVYNINLNDILVAHDAIDIKQYDDVRDVEKAKLRKLLKLPIDKKIIMHTGSIFNNRGVELFETVLQKLREYQFVQVGGNDKDIAFWKNYFKEYDNIIFVKHQEVSQLIKYQLSADLLFYMISKVTPTYWCCSPMKAFEYLGSGIPVIASNIGSLTEIFNENNSVVYDSSDNVSLIKALDFACHHPDQLKEKSKVAVENIRKMYTWEIRANKIMTFLNEKY